jgi:hypothetical protein
MRSSNSWVSSRTDRRAAGVGIDTNLTTQVEVGQAQDDAVVAMHGLHVDAEPLAHPGRDGQRPRGVHRAAEGGVDDDAPVAELVAEAFDDDHPVGRQLGDRLALLGEVTQQVVGGPLVQAGGADPFAGCGRASPPTSRTNAPTAAPSSAGRPRVSPFQNGSLPG